MHVAEITFILHFETLIQVSVNNGACCLICKFWLYWFNISQVLVVWSATLIDILIFIYMSNETIIFESYCSTLAF